jgi:chromosome segregation ATPase
MDPDLSKEVLDVRKVIEKSTSKVSLRDLEKKGFRQVKVLRAGDINQLIFKAVQNVLAKQPRGAGMSEEERQKIIADARAELDQQMAAMREMQQESQRIEAEQAYRNLEAKLGQVNQQFQAREQALQREREAFARDKQSLYEKGLEGQQSAARQFEGQIQDLRNQLCAAEQRAAGLEGAVPRQEHEDTLARAKSRLSELQQEVQETESRAQRYKKHNDQLEESEAKKARQISALEDEIKSLKEELAAAPQPTASGFGSVDGSELQRMRFEMEQRDSEMRALISGLAGTLASARQAPVAAADNGEVAKQLKAMQSSLADQLRRSIGTLGKGGGKDFDLSPEAAAALFASGKDDVVLETNISTIAVKEQQAAGVKDKLSKLKNMRGGGPK